MEPTLEQLQEELVALKAKLAEVTMERDLAWADAMTFAEREQAHAQDLLRLEEARRQREREIAQIKHDEYRKGYYAGMLAERNRG